MFCSLFRMRLQLGVSWSISDVRVISAFRYFISSTSTARTDGDFVVSLTAFFPSHRTSPHWLRVAGKRARRRTLRRVTSVGRSRVRRTPNPVEDARHTGLLRWGLQVRFQEPGGARRGVQAGAAGQEGAAGAGAQGPGEAIAKPRRGQIRVAHTGQRPTPRSRITSDPVGHPSFYLFAS